MKPLCIDLFCGLGGFSEGFLAEGWDCVGFDLERHQYGEQRYPAQLVMQDVLTLTGAQFRKAALIVASPPCQAYSYMAMPFSRGKKIAAEYRSGVRSIEDLNALFNDCFRIQREACEAAGRYIPMVVENVKGAQPWVGPAKAHYGSFYLWGDVDMVGDRIIAGGLRFGDSVKAAKRGRKNDGGSWFAIGSPGQTNVGQNPNGRKVPGMNFHDFEKTGKPGRSFQSAAVKNGGDWFSGGADCSLQRKASSVSSARKAASAQIAKIPLPLSSYLARAYRPTEGGKAP